ncbi:MAG: hypothetical protein IKF17_06105 [Clostridia bacterium]|nr:hypothetical protein [Clostridia bacterium]
MENASKALIIAGAILLSILIISLGIMIFRNASSVVNNNAMSEVEMQQFNTKFTQYEGTTVRGAQVNAMLQAVLSNNMSVDSDSRKVKVTITGTGTENIAMAITATSLPTARAATGSTYTVTCKYGNSGSQQGIVNEIQVKKNS